MKNLPAISIIMPVYNAEKDLPETIKTILSQTLEDIELVCADDKSTDGSLRMLHEFAAKDPRVKVLELPKNGGPALARKKALQASQGEFVMFADSDDLFYPYSCERALAAIREHKCDILHFNFLLMLGPDGKTHDPVPFMFPRAGRHQSETLVKLFFESDDIRQQLDHILWDKIYRGDMCRQAADAMSDDVCNCTPDDYYTFMCIAFFGKTYYGLPQKRLYVHRDYHGYSANTKRVLDGVKIVPFCREFLEKNNALESHRKALEHIEYRIYVNGLESLLRSRTLDRATLEYAVRCWGGGILVDFFGCAGFFKLRVDTWMDLGGRMLNFMSDAQQRLGGGEKRQS